jgi:glutamate N-acetyltransferase/amino-acid N-acetyltransferase
MASNIRSPLAPEQFPVLPPIDGVAFAVGETGIRYNNRPDVLLALLAPGTSVAGVLTSSKSRSAPVDWCAEKLKGGGARALIVNSGNANAFTGSAGVKTVTTVARAIAAQAKCKPHEIFQASTGVIGEPLDPAPIVRVLPQLFAHLRKDAWADAARAIMTTDTFPKAASRQARMGSVTVTLNGIAKGSGMIAPDMATMLSFIFTDAALPPRILQKLLARSSAQSFNCITVDGDTSTNDSFMLIATGQGPVIASKRDALKIEAAITDVARHLAQAIVRDGEGATKFVTVRVERGRNAEECRKVAYAIAHSPLVKTAFFASDPNLGRILAAIGYSGAEINTEKMDLYLDDVLVAKNGGRHSAYRDEQGVAAMKKAEFTVRAVLNRGKADATVWTCDFSFDYVKINAEYRT